MPTGFLPKSAPYFSTSSFGTTKREVDRHDVQEGGVGPRQLERRVGSTTRCRKLVGRRGDSSMPAIEPKKPAPGLCVFGLSDALDRVFHVVGGQLAAIVELHALAQLEGVGLAVRRDLVALGEVGHELGGAGLVVHQPVEQALDHRPVLPVVADRRVERGDVVLVGDDDLRRPAWRWASHRSAGAGETHARASARAPMPRLSKQQSFHARGSPSVVLLSLLICSLMRGSMNGATRSARRLPSTMAQADDQRDAHDDRDVDALDRLPGELADAGPAEDRSRPPRRRS